MGPVLSEDMQDLLEIFENRQVEYAIVGGFAVNFYGYIRNTQDLDLLVFPSADNAQRVMEALACWPAEMTDRVVTLSTQNLGR